MAKYSEKISVAITGVIVEDEKGDFYFQVEDMEDEIAVKDVLKKFINREVKFTVSTSNDLTSEVVEETSSESDGDDE